MLQAKMIQPQKIVFEDVEKQKVISGHVLLRINQIGICGSDIHVYYGKHPYTSYPVIQGHEFSAEIAEIGEGVTGFSVGQLVTVEPSMTCGKCYSCRHGRYNICDDLKVMGFQTDGAAREYFLVPADHVVPLPKGFDSELGALIEPLAVTVHAVRRLGEVAEKRLLVFGAGPIGNLVAQVVKALGGAVLITDLNQFRVDLARKCGLTNAINAGSPDYMDQITAFFGPDGPDAMLECVGVQPTMTQAVKYARKGTKIIVVGVFGDIPRVDLGLVQDHELELIGTLMYQRPDYLEAIELVQKQKIALENLITHKFKFEDYDLAYRTIREHTETTMKVVIQVAK